MSGETVWEDGGDRGADIGIGVAMAAACRMCGERSGSQEIGMVAQERRASCGSALTGAWIGNAM
jgi:hypothetical protein